MVAAGANLPPPDNVGERPPVAQLAAVLLPRCAVDLALGAAALLARWRLDPHGLAPAARPLRLCLSCWFALACRRHK